MVNQIMEFFGIIGMVETPPSTLSELIPYLICLCVGCVLVCCAVRLIGILFSRLFDWRR